MTPQSTEKFVLNFVESKPNLDCIVWLEYNTIGKGILFTAKATKKGNCNPNLFKINQIQKIFLCVRAGIFFSWSPTQLKVREP